MPPTAPQKSSRLVWARRARIAGVSIAAAYLALLAAVGLGYRWFLYPAKRAEREPDTRTAKLVRIEHPGEPTVFALHAVAPSASAPTLVMFHGNGEDLADEAKTVDAFAKLGVGVFAVEYPGYGLARAQRATEASIYRAAEIAIAHLDELGVDRSQRVVVGFSLGSGVAVEMAARGLASRLVVLAPYTSIPAMVGRFVPIVPVDWLVGDKFDSLSKAPRVDVPALVVHGDADALIPVGMGERLARALPNATLHVVRGAHHNDLYAVEPALRETIVAFTR